MMGAPMTETVKVWNDTLEITVYQKSKAVWIAVGEYMGKQFRGKGQTRGAAISSWRETARYNTN